jgi:hypothetical protein
VKKLLRLAITALLILPLMQARSSRGEDPPERLLAARARPGGTEGPLDWVLEKVPSGTDEWSSEKASDEINSRLKALAERIAALDFSEAALREFLGPGFRAMDFKLPPLEAVYSSDGLEVVKGLAGEGRELSEVSPAALGQGLRECFPGVSRLEKAKFKIFRIQTRSGADREVSSPAVSTRLLFEADGALQKGFLQVRAIWDAVWSKDGGAWRLREIRPVLFERARLLERRFVEITESALGANDSYRAQLSLGLDAWRTRLDSASGLDIYGHQGVSVGDYDGDGWEDIYIAQPAGLPNLLYRNRGDGTFEDVTVKAGVGVLDNTGGSLFLDLDNDGDLDLVVVTSLEVLLFENDGKGKFERRESTGLEAAGHEGASSMGCAAADYDRDGDLDLYVFCYVFWAGAGSKTHSSYPYPYHDANNGAPNYLFRNEGRLRFTNVTKSVGLDVNNRRFSLAASWCDYDSNGFPDLYVANDFGKNNLYRNEDGAFRDVSQEAGVEDTGNGMSVTWEDYDNDGKIDLYVGNMWSSAGSRLVDQPGYQEIGQDLQAIYRRMARGNSLFRNLGGGRFEDVSVASGAYFGRWSWSCQFLDPDGNGREDLYIANGFVTNENPDDL